MAGSWSTLTSAHGPANAGTMLLLTDGRVLCHDEPNTTAVNGSKRWYALAPDAHGRYETGTWTRLDDGPNEPLDLACCVLRDGRVFVAGGEYDGGADQVWLLAAELYDPVADRWHTIGTPDGWTAIGDAPSIVLPDGRVLLGEIRGRRTALYDPVANAWTPVSTQKEDGRCTEETWVLLGDQTVLALECDNHPHAEKYVIAADRWVPAGTTPVDLVDAASREIGPALALPDGRAFCIGATGNTALYTPPPVASQPGTWAAGPPFPVLAPGMTTGAKDAPAALLPNGRVLCAVGVFNAAASEDDPTGWGKPVRFFEYDPVANTIPPQLPSPANAGLDPFCSYLMLLPTGQVLHANRTATVAIYAPDGAPHPAWRPSIADVPTQLRAGSTFTLPGAPAQRALAGGALRRRGRDGDELSTRSTHAREHRPGAVLPDARPLDDGDPDGRGPPLDAVHGAGGRARRGALAPRDRERDRLEGGDGHRHARSPAGRPRASRALSADPGRAYSGRRAEDAHG
jgi:hypothetical protein